MGKVDLTKIKGAVFDLDGTILDSTWVWDKVDEKFLGARGFSVPDDYVEKLAPMGTVEAAVYTKNRFGLDDESIEEIIEEWIQMAINEYANDVVCKPYVKDYIKYLYDNDIKLVIATSSDRRLFMPTLEREGILGYFDDIVTVEEVERGKGYADIYEEAARRIGLANNECMVLEDLLEGIKAAKDADFYVISVADVRTLDQKEEIITSSDHYIESFEELL